METLTYKELRDKINTLTEDQLNQKVQFYPEERPIIEVEGFEINKEDLYYDPENPEDGCAPLTEFDEDIRQDMIVGIEAGTVMLF